MKKYRIIPYIADILAYRTCILFIYVLYLFLSGENYTFKEVFMKRILIRYDVTCVNCSGDIVTIDRYDSTKRECRKNLKENGFKVLAIVERYGYK